MHLLTLKLIKLIRQDALYCKHMQIKHPVIHINANMNFIYNKIYMEKVRQCGCRRRSGVVWLHRSNHFRVKAEHRNTFEKVCYKNMCISNRNYG